MSSSSDEGWDFGDGGDQAADLLASIGLDDDGEGETGGGETDAAAAATSPGASTVTSTTAAAVGGGADSDDDGDAGGDDDEDTEDGSDSSDLLSDSSSEDSEDAELCLKLDYGVYAMKGRRKTMEDAHTLISSVHRMADEAGEDATVRHDGFFAVYDGHGGSTTAEYLAEKLHENVFASRDARIQNLDDVDGRIMVEALEEGVNKTEADFLALALKDMIDSGSTGVMAMVAGRELVVTNVGDSEAVLCHNGRARCLSTLHNPKKNKGEVDRVKAAGGKLFHKRLAHPTMPPSMCNIAVSRAFGDLMFKHDDFTQGKPSGLIADPDSTAVDLTTKDEFLILACDGVWDVLNYQEAVDLVNKTLVDTDYNAEAAATALVKEAYNKQSGDNISAIIIVFQFLDMAEAVDEYEESQAPAAPAAPVHEGPPINGSRRNLRGTPNAEMFGWAPAGSVEEMGGLDVQAFIQQVIRANPHDIDGIVSLPPAVDGLVWQYEHLRQLTLELGYLTVALMDVCTADVCPKMKATDEWMFLCAAHRNATECCAIDYILHTLDGTAALLNSNKHFPYRSSIEDKATMYFCNISRRLYRINAHAYFHHRKAFDEFEARTSLTKRFQRLIDAFNLVPKKSCIIPTL